MVEVAIPADPDSAGALATELVALSGRGIEERGDRYVAYLPASSEDSPEELIARLHGGAPPEDATTPEILAWRWQAQEAWEEIWRRGLEPRWITPRILVSPTWSPPQEVGDGVEIRIDPGMAFGTAEHATTRGCLRLLDGRVRAGDRVADVGSGSGILSIAAALLGAKSVIAVEMDEWACVVARENVEQNGVTERVRVIAAEVDDRFVPGELPFDGIVANIESGTLHRLLPVFRRGLREGGFLILSGILLPESASISGRAIECGFASDGEDREGEWWGGAFRAGRSSSDAR